MLDTVSMESLRKKAGLGYVGLSYSLNIDVDRWPVNCPGWAMLGSATVWTLMLTGGPWIATEGEGTKTSSEGCVTFMENHGTLNHWIFLNLLQEIQVGHQKFTGKGSTRRFEAFQTDELLNGRPGWSFLYSLQYFWEWNSGATLLLDRRTIYINGNSVLIYLNLEQAFLQICILPPTMSRHNPNFDAVTKSLWIAGIAASTWSHSRL